jgi:putative ABC transport system permease protein
MFAILGVVLAAAGIYGVMAHLVTMRTGEIGIRMTLGARPSGVLRQVLREALTHAAIGLAIGLVAAALAMRAAQTLLFEIQASDPVTFAVTVATVLAVAGLAAIIPAVRAMRVDPLAALRAE